MGVNTEPRPEARSRVSICVVIVYIIATIVNVSAIIASSSDMSSYTRITAATPAGMERNVRLRMNGAVGKR